MQFVKLVCWKLGSTPTIYTWRESVLLPPSHVVTLTLKPHSITFLFHILCFFLVMFTKARFLPCSVSTIRSKKVLKITLILLSVFFLASSLPSSMTMNIQIDGGGGGGGGGGGVNVLHKHAAFFDLNKDGLIYPSETFQGLRAIGCGVALSTAGAIFINVGLSGKTRPGKFPSLLFPIEIKNINKGKHGSDSGVYDKEGRFVLEKFEEIFCKHSQSNSDALTAEELSRMLKVNREPKDYFGRLASFTEWKLLYNLGKDKNGLLHKDTVRAVYDGSLFEQLAKKKASAQDT